VAERVSALAGHYKTGHFGEAGEAGVTLNEIPDPVLHQIAAWPETLQAVGAKAATAAGAGWAPGPGAASAGDKGALLRVEPLKWWIYGVEAPALNPEEGATLDLSHARSHLRIAGREARSCLNRLVSLDLREHSFPVGAVGSTALHHVGVTLWRSADGFELFVPRGFAVSLWEVLFDTAVQFGVEVGEPAVARAQETHLSE
jgi:heterotetrameric sarcosine oxidase gamma subunit